MTMCPGSCSELRFRGRLHTGRTVRPVKERISIAVVLIKDVAPPKRRTTPMTAFTAPRTAQRRSAGRAPRATTFASVRESLDGFRGALRAATSHRGGDYTDALFLGRN